MTYRVESSVTYLDGSITHEYRAVVSILEVAQAQTKTAIESYERNAAVVYGNVKIVQDKEKTILEFTYENNHAKVARGFLKAVDVMALTIARNQPSSARQNTTVELARRWARGVVDKFSESDLFSYLDGKGYTYDPVEGQWERHNWVKPSPIVGWTSTRLK